MLSRLHHCLPSLYTIWRGLDEAFGGDVEVASRRHAQIVVPSAATNLLECLNRDRNAFAHLTSFLYLVDVAKLATSCSRIHQWLLFARPSSLQTADWCVWDARIECLARCEWARRLVRNLAMNSTAPLPTPAGLRRILCAGPLLRPALRASFLAAMPWPAAKLWLQHFDRGWHQVDRWWTDLSQRMCIEYCERFAYDSARNALLSLPRLERLQELIWPVNSELDTEAVFACFKAIGDTLQKLTVILAPSKFAAGARATIMSHIAHLRNLRMLVVVRRKDNGVPARPLHFRHFQVVDLSGLPRLEFLHTFQFTAVDDGWFFPSPAQCAYLACCTALTDLSCGGWDAPPPMGDEFGNPLVLESEESFLAQRIGVLAVGKGQTRLAEPDAAVMDQPPQILSHGLRILHMASQSKMTRSLWTHLSKLVELESLCIRSWSDQITEEEWAQLGKMTRLLKLQIGGARINPAHVLLPLCCCTALTKLIWADVPMIEDDLQTLIVSLPALRALHLWFSRVSSLAPLNHCSLTVLELAHLRKEYGQPIASHRLMLKDVSLPRLTSLHITDAEEGLSTAEAEELNQAIFDACPLLLKSEFKQNLRPEPEV